MVYTGYFCRFLLKDVKTNPMKSPFACTPWLVHDVWCRNAGSGENRWCVAAWLWLHWVLTLSIGRVFFFSFMREECWWHDMSSVNYYDLKEASRWRVWCWRGGEDMTSYGFCVSFLPVLVSGFTVRSSSHHLQLWHDCKEEENCFLFPYCMRESFNIRHLQEQSVFFPCQCPVCFSLCRFNIYQFIKYLPTVLSHTYSIHMHNISHAALNTLSIFLSSSVSVLHAKYLWHILLVQLSQPAEAGLIIRKETEWPDVTPSQTHILYLAHI